MPMMLIGFRSRKLKKLFESNRELVKAFGQRMAVAIQNRLVVLDASSHLGKVPTVRPERCHALKQDRHGEYAVDLIDQWRLIFRPDHDPVPTLPDGGIDLTSVTAIEILEVSDHYN